MKMTLVHHQHHPPTTTRNSLSAISQLLLAQCWPNFKSTGCFRFIVKMFELITQAIKQSISYNRWHFLLLIGTFWYLVGKKIHNYSEIIHHCSLWRWKTVEICKMQKYAHAYFIACVRIFVICAHLGTRIFTNIFVEVYYYHMNFSF